MLEIKRFIFGPFQTNTYVVSDEQRVLIIDPACVGQREQEILKEYISNVQCPMSNVQIVATHGHLDHLWGAKWATEQWNTPVLVPEADIPMAERMQEQYDLFGIPAKAESFRMSGLEDEGISGVEIISTPGHTPGSVCLYWPQEKVLLSGDTLFCMGYGRTDLPGGNMMALIDSLQRLFELPADVRVYPGHGDATTIGDERR